MLNRCAAILLHFCFQNRKGIIKRHSALAAHIAKQISITSNGKKQQKASYRIKNPQKPTCATSVFESNDDCGERPPSVGPLPPVAAPEMIAHLLAVLAFPHGFFTAGDTKPRKWYKVSGHACGATKGHHEQRMTSW